MAETPAALDHEPPPPAPSLTGRLRAALRALVPWASLAAGIAGAVFMDRGPQRGALVAGAAVGSWLTLPLVQWLGRASARAETRRWAWRLLRWSSLTAAQSRVQLALFFALPFYVRAAAAWDPGHLVFLSGLAVLSAVSLWDPLTERLFHRPLLAPLLPAIASFVALAAVLPGLGFSTRASLWIAAFTCGLGVAFTSAAGAPAGARLRVAGLALLVALAIPLALRLGAARIVPAAPLRLVQIAIGTQRAGHWVGDPSTRLATAPARLICATAIWSPLGVKDRLFHVWTRDGQLRARVELDIRGGRPGGYRTFSRIGPLGRSPGGVYRCRVETQSGQVLGGQTIRIGGG